MPYDLSRLSQLREQLEKEKSKVTEELAAYIDSLAQVLGIPVPEILEQLQSRFSKGASNAKEVQARKTSRLDPDYLRSMMKKEHVEERYIEPK